MENNLGKILVVDDDQTMRFVLTTALKKRGYQLEDTSCAEDALDILKTNSFDLIIIDVKLPKMSGIEAISWIKEIDPQAIIILVTAYDRKEIALKAIKAGAYDYFTKPFSLEEMEIIVKRALEKRKLQVGIKELRDKIGRNQEFKEFIGQSKGMQKIMELINKVAPLDLTVLITGESGTGKELTAAAIHQKSKRHKAPFVKVNCAAIPETLLESELFGHEKGAFTGAHKRRLGKFELAHQGTIFMDEIGDMTPATQAKILRLLEQKELERVGGKETLKIDVRVIAATNQNLILAINEKRFREDLYFRLNVFHILLPPLRDRKEDIPILVDHFIHEANLRLGKEICGISADAMKLLLDYQWRGNIRELKNSIERAVALTDADFITSDVIVLSFNQGTKTSSGLNTPEAPMSLSNTLEEVERQLIFDALLKTGAVQVEAAKILGITEKNLWKKIKKHKIDPKQIKKDEKENKTLKQV